MPKDLPGFPKSKVKGAVKFCPFENLDGEALGEVRRFRVAPLGGIRDNCRHIPYNSGKKDFFEKTGRESFEGTSLLSRMLEGSSPYWKDGLTRSNSLPVHLQTAR